MPRIEVRHTWLGTNRCLVMAGALFALLSASAAFAHPATRAATWAQAPQKQVAVLMYHQVTDTPIGTSAGEGHYGPAVTPQQFDADLTFMASIGFAPVDPLVALQYLNGQTDGSSLPAHPYVVTFDDGFESAWTNATPILKAHGAKAMMFVEGARTGTTAGRLTAGDIRAMAASGTWEIESHGYAGHSNLQIGPSASDVSPYWYANLAWLPSQGRPETPAEYETRIFEDLQHSKTMLESITGAAVTAFAYPSGEFGQSVATPSGGDPGTIGADQGHSNAAGLTPLFFDALRRAGLRDAFAVVLPGSEAAASRAFAPYELPRVGGNPQTYQPSMRTLADGEFALPAVSPGYQWLDCKAIGASSGDIWVASSTQPYIYQMDDETGRVESVVNVPALSAGRKNEPTLVAGLVAGADGTFVAYEQRGWWSGGQARLIRFRIASDAARDVTTVPLAAPANWLVGMTELNGTLAGIDEEGGVFALASSGVRELFALPNDSPGWLQGGVGRFAGLALAKGKLYTADRKTAQLLTIRPADGAVIGTQPLPAGADIRALGGGDTYLWLVNYAQDRRMLTRLSEAGAP